MFGLLFGEICFLLIMCVLMFMVMVGVMKGREWLIISICFLILIIIFIVGKMILVFGFVVSIVILIYVGIFLVMDVLYEYYGFDVVKKGVMLGFFCMLLVILIG